MIIEDALALHRFEQLDVRVPHVLRLTELPRLHGDPFDRMLVAQAIEERCVLVTQDRVVQGYPVEHLWRPATAGRALGPILRA